MSSSFDLRLKRFGEIKGIKEIAAPKQISSNLLKPP
jgi:hypothetical protein